MAMAWGERTVERQTIGGERRAGRRYSICLDVQWKIVHRRRVVESGTGRTRDLSSHGILFDAGRRLTSGRYMELSIAWPVLLHDKAPLKLVASGRVVRSDETCTAIRMTRHDFFTAGIQPVRRKEPAAAASKPQPAWNAGYSGGLLRN
jgi:hypothetical protein